MAKRILRVFKINEISACDKPAQEGALALIMKRDQGNPGANVLQFKRKEQAEMNYGTIDTGALALLALNGAAVALRKQQPDLTEEQAFARVYADPANRVAAKAERAASRHRIAGYPVARTEPEIPNTLSDAEIRRLVEQERARFPFLDGEELYARVDASPEMQRHRAARRQSVAAAARAGRQLLSPRSVEVVKREDALDELRAKAAELRKQQPGLSEEQAFAKIYKFEPALAARERRAARAALHA